MHVQIKYIIPITYIYNTDNVRACLSNVLAWINLQFGGNYPFLKVRGNQSGARGKSRAIYLFSIFLLPGMFV